jgi:hypothetical protein
VTLTYTGTGTLTLSQLHAEYFVLGSLTSIEQTEDNPTASYFIFTVQPVSGLSAGTYSDTITITSEQGTTASVNVSFIVNAKPTYEMKAEPATLDFGTLEEGYTTPAAQTVTITNTGTGALTLTQPTASNFEVGSLSTVTLESQNAAATVSIQPKAGLTAGSYIDTITITGNDGATATVTASFTVTTKTVKLVGIQNPSDITGLTNGVKKSAEGLKLPSTVTISTTNGDMKANVSWDVKNCDYSAKSTAKQSFTVSGTVTLPSGIANPDNISLTASVKVTVNAYAAKTASADENKITGISSDTAYDTQSRISFTAVGAGMDNDSPRAGDTRYVPYYWKVINTNSWDAAPYTATFGMAKAGTYTLMVVFNQQSYDGSKWSNTGAQDSKSVTFTVVDAEVTSVPGQTLTPAANSKDAVQTGDNTPILPFVVILILAVVCVAGIVIYRKKK